MNRTKVITPLAIGVLALAFGSAARADTILDPLHGFCNGTTPVTTTCVDGGANTPLGSDTTRFGFWISPGPQTGDLSLVILLPDDQTAPPSFAITGDIGAGSTTFTASQVSGDWQTGDLQAFLGLTGYSPANPIGAYLPNAQALDSAANGFFVYSVDLGTVTIPASATYSAPIFDYPLSPDLALGSYIVGFCDTCVFTNSNGKKKTDNVATANSGALLVTDGRVPPEQIPEPGVLALLSLALLGLGVTSSRRRV